MDMVGQATEFIAEKRRRKAKATYEQYRTVLEAIWLPWCREAGIALPTEATDKVMDGFLDYLQGRTNRGKPLSIPTIRTYLRTVRIFLNWCEVAKGHFEQPRQPRRLMTTLTREEVATMERVADTERDRLIVRVLADTGVRVSELLGITLGDLRANSHDRKYLVRVIGKGDKERELVLDYKLFMRLRDYATGMGGGFMFQTPTRTRRLNKWDIEKLVKKLALRAGIQRRVWPHLFRHTYATLMLTRGINPIVVQKTLGHESLAMISQTYSHVLTEDVYDQLIGALR